MVWCFGIGLSLKREESRRDDGGLGNWQVRVVMEIRSLSTELSKL